MFLECHKIVVVMLIKCINLLLLDIKLSITLASRLAVLNVDSVLAKLHGFIQYVNT